MPAVPTQRVPEPMALSTLELDDEVASALSASSQPYFRSTSIAASADQSQRRSSPVPRVTSSSSKVFPVPASNSLHTHGNPQPGAEDSRSVGSSAVHRPMAGNSMGSNSTALFRTPERHPQAPPPPVMPSAMVMQDYGSYAVDHGTEIASLRSAVQQLQRTMAAHTALPGVAPVQGHLGHPSLYVAGSSVATVPVLPPVAPQVLLVTPRSHFGSVPPSPHGGGHTAPPPQYLLNEISSMRSHLAGLHQQVERVRQRKHHQRHRKRHGSSAAPLADPSISTSPASLGLTSPYCCGGEPCHHCCRSGAGSPLAAGGSTLPRISALWKALSPERRRHATGSSSSSSSDHDHDHVIAGGLTASALSAVAAPLSRHHPQLRGRTQSSAVPYANEVDGLRKVLEKYESIDLSPSRLRPAGAGGGPSSPSGVEPVILREVASIHASLDKQHQALTRQQDEVLHDTEDELMLALERQQLHQLNAEQQRQLFEAQKARERVLAKQYQQQLTEQQKQYQKILNAQQEEFAKLVAQQQHQLAQVQQDGEAALHQQQMLDAERLAQEQAATAAAAAHLHGLVTKRKRKHRRHDSSSSDDDRSPSKKGSSRMPDPSNARSSESQILRLKNSMNEMEQKHRDELERADEREKEIKDGYKKKLEDLKEKLRKMKKESSPHSARTLPRNAHPYPYASPAGYPVQGGVYGPAPGEYGSPYAPHSPSYNPYQAPSFDPYDGEAPYALLPLDGMGGTVPYPYPPLSSRIDGDNATSRGASSRPGNDRGRRLEEPPTDSLEADPLMPPLNGRRSPCLGMADLEKRVDHLEAETRQLVHDSAEAGGDAVRDVVLRVPMQQAARQVEEVCGHLDHQQQELANLARDLTAETARGGRAVDTLAPGGSFDRLQTFREELVDSKRRLEDGVEKVNDQLHATQQKAKQDIEKMRQRLTALDQEYHHIVEDRDHVADAIAKVIAVVNEDGERLKEHKEGPVNKEVEKRHQMHQDDLRREKERLDAVDKKLREIERERNHARDHVASMVDGIGRDLTRAAEKLQKAANAGEKKVKDLSDQLKRLHNAHAAAEKSANENAKKLKEREKRKKERAKQREKNQKNKEKSNAARLVALQALGVGQAQAPTSPPPPPVTIPVPVPMRYGQDRPEATGNHFYPSEPSDRYAHRAPSLLYDPFSAYPSPASFPYTDDSTASEFESGANPLQCPPECSLGCNDPSRQHYAPGQGQRRVPNAHPIASSTLDPHRRSTVLMPPGPAPAIIPSGPSEVEKMLQDSLAKEKQQHDKDVEELRRKLDAERKKREAALQLMRDEEFAPALAKIQSATDAEIAALAHQLKDERARHQREMDELNVARERERKRKEDAEKALRESRSRDAVSGRDAAALDALQEKLRQEREHHARELEELRRQLEAERARQQVVTAEQHRRNGSGGDPGGGAGASSSGGSSGAGRGRKGNAKDSAGEGGSRSGSSGASGASRQSSAEKSMLRQQLAAEQKKHEDEVQRLKEMMAREKAEREAALVKLASQQHLSPSSKASAKKKFNDAEREELRRQLEEEQKKHQRDVEQLQREVERGKKAVEQVRRASNVPYYGKGRDPQAEKEAKEAAEKLEQLQRQHQIELMRQKEALREEQKMQAETYSNQLADMRTLLESQKAKERFDGQRRSQEKERLSHDLDLKNEILKQKNDTIRKQESLLRSPSRSRSTSLMPMESPSSPYLNPVATAKKKKGHSGTHTIRSRSPSPALSPSGSSHHTSLLDDPFHTHRSSERGSRVGARIYTMVQGGEWLKEKYKEEPVYARPQKEVTELGSAELLTPSQARKRGKSLQLDPLFPTLSPQRELRRMSIGAATTPRHNSVTPLSGSPFKSPKPEF